MATTKVGDLLNPRHRRCFSSFAPLSLLADEGLLTDITPLLSLPQKVAAAMLGLSESMLCKRFKACTQRKWPYRQLCKIDRAIAHLTAKTAHGTTATADSRYDKRPFEVI